MTRPPKYHNEPTFVDGIRFASKLEARRYTELKLLERAGEVRDLVLQPRYQLMHGAALICTYVGDFQYTDRRSGKTVTEDAKGVETPEFKIKAKLFAAQYGYEITLIKRKSLAVPARNAEPPYSHQMAD